MFRKPEYYDVRIARLRATIKRLFAEKRVVILRKREKELSALPNDQGGQDG
jgi:hypothetical protein